MQQGDLIAVKKIVPDEKKLLGVGGDGGYRLRVHRV